MIDSGLGFNMANMAERVNHHELVDLSTLNDFVHAFQRGEIQVIKSTLQIGAAFFIGTFGKSESSMSMSYGILMEGA